ncbi:sterol desaturase family protein [Thalassotalea euphylliae]|uniref:Sterol desaturase family protein n=1 Tax=Thalassotalea euphylliae TaxID=1655234 RepID=A0A3E0ULV9_9GAMM|nr:sterol desaturase family protein [Thalassotalea euphylliae]REL37265.1 sterol desaturase family protein [Thalassotalea euphylliae]
MSVELILIALSPIFLLFMVAEYLKYRHFYEVKDSLSNMALGASYQVSDTLILFLLMPVFIWLHQFSLFEIPFTGWTLLIGFIIQDFLYYWFHRASHFIHWFWVAHIAHHSSNKLNFSTAFRQSVLYPITGMWLFWLPMILAGFEPTMVFAIVALNLAFQFFIHTQAVGKLGWIEKVFNTPSHHRVHHSTNREYIDKNFAGILIIWDKMFGTFIEEKDEVPCKFGIVGELPGNNPIKANIDQGLHMLRKLKQAKGWQQKRRVLFGYPTHE